MDGHNMLGGVPLGGSQRVAITSHSIILPNDVQIVDFTCEGMPCERALRIINMVQGHAMYVPLVASQLTYLKESVA